MRRLIYVSIDLTKIPNEVPKSKWSENIKEITLKAINEFKKEVKPFKLIRVIKDYFPDPQILVEFDEINRQEVYDNLGTISIVETIDSFLR